jgi:hypothetical protein
MPWRAPNGRAPPVEGTRFRSRHRSNNKRQFIHSFIHSTRRCESDRPQGESVWLAVVGASARYEEGGARAARPSPNRWGCEASPSPNRWGCKRAAVGPGRALELKRARQLPASKQRRPPDNRLASVPRPFRPNAGGATARASSCCAVVDDDGRQSKGTNRTVTPRVGVQWRPSAIRRRRRSGHQSPLLMRRECLPASVAHIPGILPVRWYCTSSQGRRPPPSGSTTRTKFLVRIHIPGIS